ncbi:energy transducer TonB [Vibrio sp. DW001]|uniref:energy transducer TonB n=1 Tax=Vibrio sp. DW001 TaxID=2912315 RepID=UPI0023AF64F5|nr:energy transducer TonB [Vibrio sp. DW001]WED28967.1 energy transducer TonB [Vibrio sp. DW001]
MLRFLMALPLALFISYGLMGLMAWMVDLNTIESKPKNASIRFDFFMNETEQLSQRKSRELPKPPEMKPLPPEQALAQPQQDVFLNTPTLAPIPEVNLALSVTDMKFAVVVPSTPSPKATNTPLVQQPISVKMGQTQQLMPLHRMNPIYPRKALQRKIEGYVVFSFDIDRAGKPQNIKIEESYPSRVFNREALKALKRWKYQPMMVNGLAQVRSGQRVKLEFKIQ